MNATAKLGALLTLGVILCASGYEVYSSSTEDQNDRIACLTVHSNDAVQAVEKDLLIRPHTEMFGKQRITIGSMFIHSEKIEKTGTRLVVPFTLTSNRRGQSDFNAVVRCSNLQDIEYDKL